MTKWTTPWLAYLAFCGALHAQQRGTPSEADTISYINRNLAQTASNCRGGIAEYYISVEDVGRFIFVHRNCDREVVRIRVAASEQ